MTEAITLYDHIAANNRKTFWLILLFPLSLALLVGLASVASVYIINDPEFSQDGLSLLLSIFPQVQEYITPENIILWGGIGYAIIPLVPMVVIAFLWMAISYRFGDKMMLSFAQAVQIEKKDFPLVFRSVENVAIAAGLPTPKVFVINDASLNAFATGRDPETASITLTTGIIQKLEPLELEAVIAHEMAHIGNRDIRLTMLIVTGLGVFGFLADFLRMSLRNSSRNSNKKQGQAVLFIFLLMVALLIFNLLVAPLIRLAISRSREYAADATGALITRNPEALISALQKISQDARVEVLDKQPGMAIACVADPREKDIAKVKDGWFSTHPAIENRVARLRHTMLRM